ncbi:MAG: DUF4823 domain-containing protein [Oceanicoccus sp.]
MIPSNRFFLASVTALIVLLSLTACQPAFTARQTDYYAGQMGIKNSFDIKRWHNTVLSPASNLVVVCQSTERNDQTSFSQTVANGLSPYFQSVTGGYSAESLQSAQTLSKQDNSHYLVFVQVTDTDSVFASRQDETGGGSFSEIHLLLTIIDIVSGSTVDKITLSSDTGYFDILGDDKDELLAKALNQIGHDLSGA